MKYTMTYPQKHILFDKYRVEKLIGQGTSGDVYQVYHLGLNCERAIKILRLDNSLKDSAAAQDIRDRFKMEAKLGAMLHNPYLLQVHDFINHDDTLILEMEYAVGGNLAQRLQKQRVSGEAFAVEEAIKIALQVCEGLAAIHAIDLVHRDIKPANILFDDKGNAKLADLGLAQVTEGPSLRDILSEPRPHPGTPGYMSPEQMDSRQYLKPSSDIYSLGLVLFEMISGRFYKNMPDGTQIKNLRPDVPRQLNDVLRKMLSNNPNDRPFDGEATARLLRLCLETANKNHFHVQVMDFMPNEPHWNKNVMVLMGVSILVIFTALCSSGIFFVSKLQENSSAFAGALQPPATRSPTSTPTPGPGSTHQRQTDGMLELFVPAGPFWRGSELVENEQPLDQIYLNAFWIDQTEVTNEMYAKCVQAVVCPPVSDTRYYGDKNRAKHPVVYVTWEKAHTYCKWTGAHLPSEAEWEKAARGIDGRTYPWGETLGQNYANYGYPWRADTTAVGRYPSGKSPYGALDMAGNVWEWTADWSGNYDSSVKSNPHGPENGDMRIMRGGSSWTSWQSQYSYTVEEVSPRAAMRWAFAPEDFSHTIGFRCARDAEPFIPAVTATPAR